VVKQPIETAVLIWLIALLLSACTSPSDDTISSQSSSQSAATVPGEKMTDDERFAPGAMGSSNVRW
jgi:PBP1b-binding outer membrane lipoprotein LpoB